MEMLTRLEQPETGVRKMDADDVEAPCLHLMSETFDPLRQAVGRFEVFQNN